MFEHSGTYFGISTVHIIMYVDRVLNLCACMFCIFKCYASLKAVFTCLFPSNCNIF